jgi:hypothetical protein
MIRDTLVAFLSWVQIDRNHFVGTCLAFGYGGLVLKYLWGFSELEAKSTSVLGHVFYFTLWPLMAATLWAVAFFFAIVLSPLYLPFL